MPQYALPVLMYHHINNYVDDLVTISPQGFEAQMAYLAGKGYQTPDMECALALLRGKKPLTGKEVLLTFDDGFLDNWVYAYPILKKYGLRAIIFLTTGFVEVEGLLRPHLGQVWQGEISAEQLPAVKGHNEFDYRAVMVEKKFGLYLRWSELARMEAEGVIDVQAHAHFHGEYFSGKEITDFNSNPQGRLALTTGGDSRLGIPIYERKAALLGRRYQDDPRLRDHLAHYVENRGESGFFERPKEEWRQELQAAGDGYIRQHGLQDGYEGGEEYEQRVKADLTLCKQLIESKLNKKCPALAWPWGAYNEQLLKWAQGVGYQAAFSTERGGNPAGSDLMRLKRCVVKKGGLRWFSRQLFTYSRPGVSRLYLKVRRHSFLSP